jgi:hypothetical protein
VVNGLAGAANELAALNWRLEVVRSRGRATVTKQEAVHRMIEVLNAEEARQFSIGLAGYFIEGEPYSAGALTVDGDSTTDLCATDDGFSGARD